MRKPVVRIRRRRGEGAEEENRDFDARAVYDEPGRSGDLETRKRRRETVGTEFNCALRGVRGVSRRIRRAGQELGFGAPVMCHSKYEWYITRDIPSSRGLRECPARVAAAL